MTSMKPTRPAVVLSIVFALTSLGAWGTEYEWFHSLWLGYARDTNLTLEIDKARRLDDQASELGLSLGASREVGRGRRQTWFADLSAARWRDVGELDRERGSLGLSYRHKLGLGRFAPWWKASLAHTWWRFDDDLRDRGVWTFDAEYGRRVCDRFLWAASLGFDRSAGRSSEVFDGQGWAGKVRGTYELTGRLSLLGHVRRRQGEVVIQNWAGAYDIDPWAWADRFWRTHGNEKRKVVIRLDDATTDEWGIGLSYALTRRSSLNLTWTRHETHWNDWLYDGQLLGLTYLLDF